MPGPGPGPGIFFQKKNKKINQPSNGGGPGPWGPIYIYIYYKFLDDLSQSSNIKNRLPIGPIEKSNLLNLTFFPIRRNQ